MFMKRRSREEGKEEDKKDNQKKNDKLSSKEKDVFSLDKKISVLDRINQVGISSTRDLTRFGR